MVGDSGILIITTQQKDVAPIVAFILATPIGEGERHNDSDENECDDEPDDLVGERRSIHLKTLWVERSSSTEVRGTPHNIYNDSRGPNTPPELKSDGEEQPDLTQPVRTTVPAKQPRNAPTADQAVGTFRCHVAERTALQLIR